MWLSVHQKGPTLACIYQVEIDRTFSKLLEDALIRLAAGMEVEGGRQSGKRTAESLAKKIPGLDMILDFRILCLLDSDSRPSVRIYLTSFFVYVITHNVL